MFLEETGHEIDWQGVVWAVSGVGHHLARAVLVFGHLPLRARDFLRFPLAGQRCCEDRGVRAIWSLGTSILWATGLLNAVHCGLVDVRPKKMRAVVVFWILACGP